MRTSFGWEGKEEEEDVITNLAAKQIRKPIHLQIIRAAD